MTSGICCVPDGCVSKADIILVYDGPDALKDNYKPLSEAMSSFVQYFKVKRDTSARFALVQLAPSPYLVMDWNDSSNKTPVELITNPKTGRKTKDADKLIENLMEGALKRKNAKTFVVIFTDRQMEKGDAAEKAAQKLQQKGVKVFVVAIGKKVNDDEVSKMSSKPEAYYTVRVPSFAAVKEAILPMAARTCHGEYQCNESP